MREILQNPDCTRQEMMAIATGREIRDGELAILRLWRDENPRMDLDKDA